MAFQLKARESISDGVKRNVRREIEKALNSLPLEGKSKNEVSESEAVHEIRKCFKKVRAALRLVRDDLGDEFYHEENFAFRDAARPLTTVRDAEMLIETFDKLHEKLTDQIDSSALLKLRDALQINQKEVHTRILKNGRAFAGVKKFAAGAMERLLEWKIEHDGWEALQGGLRHVYRMGHKALSLAAENPSVTNLHEWRKQSKYLWHLLQLLEFVWKDHEKGLSDQAHQLARLLGEDHDLAVLRQTLAADPLTYGGHRFLKDLFVLMDRSRKEFEKQAFAMGRQLYKESPEVFTARMGSYWKTQAPRSLTRFKPTLRPRLVPSRVVKQRGIS